LGTLLERALAPAASKWSRCRRVLASPHVSACLRSCCSPYRNTDAWPGRRPRALRARCQGVALGVAVCVLVGPRAVWVNLERVSCSGDKGALAALRAEGGCGAGALQNGELLSCGPALSHAPADTRLSPSKSRNRAAAFRLVVSSAPEAELADALAAGLPPSIARWQQPSRGTKGQ